MSKSKHPQHATKGKIATHITGAGTQKYQTNGPTEWLATFKEIAEKVGGKGAPIGLGIRACLAFAVDQRGVVGGAVKAVDGAIKAVDLLPDAPKPAPKAKPAKAKAAKAAKAEKAQAAA